MTGNVWFYREGVEFAEVTTGRFTRRLVSENVDKGTATSREVPRCWRCGGAGGSDAWKFTGWTCYRCGGVGTDNTREYRLYSAEKLAKLDATKAKRVATKEAKRVSLVESRRAAFEADNADLLARARKVAETADREKWLNLFAILADANNDAYLSSERLEWLENLLVAYEKSTAREAAWAAESAASEYVGEVGERLRDVEATLKFRKFTGYSTFGYNEVSNYVAKLVDTDGNMFVYFGAKPPAGDNGATVFFTATVKEHKDYNGEKNTYLARPIWSYPEVAEETETEEEETEA